LILPVEDRALVVTLDSLALPHSQKASR